MASGCDDLSGWYKSASRRYARFAASLLLFMGSWRHTKGSTEHQCGFDVLEEDEEAPEEDDAAVPVEMQELSGVNAQDVTPEQIR